MLPNYTILGTTDILPGLLMKTLPPKPVFNEPIKFVLFSDVYLKNVEIEISPTLENSILEFARKYRTQKYGKIYMINLISFILFCRFANKCSIKSHYNQRKKIENRNTQYLHLYKFKRNSKFDSFNKKRKYFIFQRSISC